MKRKVMGREYYSFRMRSTILCRVVRWKDSNTACAIRYISKTVPLRSTQFVENEEEANIYKEGEGLLKNST